MRREFALIITLAAALVFATSAQAQEAPNSDAIATPTDVHDGYRVAASPSGFELIEHGIWRRPEPDASAIAPARKPARPNLPFRSTAIAEARARYRRASYLPRVYAAEAQYGLPIGLLDALVWTESRYDPMAISKAGAIGLGQLMPGTARDLGVPNRFDPVANIFGAARYLRQMLDKFGIVHLALAAYNAGPAAAERAGGIPHNGETPAYVRNVLRNW